MRSTVSLRVVNFNSEKLKVNDLDDDKKAQMVNNLMVAIVSDQGAQPVEEIKPLDTILKSGTERSPLLYKDGTFKMNVGPIEFK